MTTPVLRRFGALAASVALFTSVATMADPANATPAATPLSTGADWVAAQLTNGIVHDNQYNFDDVGGSINAAYDLKLAGGHASDVASIVTAVGSRITGSTGYIESTEYPTSGPTTTGYYANAAANALVFAQEMGEDPTTYGGTNLVTAVENRIPNDSGAQAGQIADQSIYGNYANTIGQALAARGLATANSPKATEALNFLIDQQCSAGYFRLYPKESNNSWTCQSGIAAGKSPADTDTTSLVIQQLQPLAQTNPQAARALGKAEVWLLNQQHSDGSFGGGPSTPAPNANSTGLAGTVLGNLGDNDAAINAAVWVRQHQVQTTACASALTSQTGAIAYNDAAMKLGESKGIPTTAAGQWRSATFQALPVLQWAPTTGGTLKAAATTGYVQAGKSTNVTVSGLVPGAAACVTSGTAKVSAAAGINGSATVGVLMPAGTATRTVAVNDGTSTANASVKVLAAKVLGLAVPLRPRANQTIRITVSGLAAGEHVTLRYGKIVRSAKATAKGTYTTTISAGPIGKRSLVVTGQFANRRGAKTLTVIR